MKRTLDCFCGTYLEGDDEELINWEAHVQRQHPDMELTDEQIRQIVAEGAYDTQGKMHEK